MLIIGIPKRLEKIGVLIALSLKGVLAPTWLQSAFGVRFLGNLLRPVV